MHNKRHRHQEMQVAIRINKTIFDTRKGSNRVCPTLKLAWVLGSQVASTTQAPTQYFQT